MTSVIWYSFSTLVTQGGLRCLELLQQNKNCNKLHTTEISIF